MQISKCGCYISIFSNHIINKYTDIQIQPPHKSGAKSSLHPLGILRKRDSLWDTVDYLRYCPVSRWQGGERGVAPHACVLPIRWPPPAACTAGWTSRPGPAVFKRRCQGTQSRVDIVTGDHDALGAWELKAARPSGPGARQLRQAANDVINYSGRGLGSNNAAVITFSYGKTTVETGAWFKWEFWGPERASEWVGVHDLWYL